jgi:hypothetical protein
MEIMKTCTLFRRKIATALSCVLLTSASSLLASDLVLHKVPAAAPLRRDSITVGLVTYGSASQAAPRCLYVSSGSDVKLANNIVDPQPGRAYNFASNDATPTTVIDLGSARHINRVSAQLAPQQGSISVYVLQALPDTSIDAAPSDLPSTFKMSADELAQMRPVARVNEDGSRGDLAADFAPTTGRYVMLRWNPAAKDRAFTLAQVAAFGADDEQKPEPEKAKKRVRNNDVSDSKTVVDSKDLGESKDVPAVGEGPAPVGEGPGAPPPGLPPPPPFTFIPQIVPRVPPPQVTPFSL